MSLCFDLSGLLSVTSSMRGPWFDFSHESAFTYISFTVHLTITTGFGVEHKMFQEANM